MGLCVCLLSHISPLECLFVLNILSHTQRPTEVKNLVGFSETAPFKTYGVICLPVTSYEGTAATFRALFRQHSFLRVLKRLNNRLNTTWNTTGCKAASFFLLVSVFPLKSSVYFLLHVIRVLVSIARAFLRILACAFKDSPRVLHFSAFI